MITIRHLHHHIQQRTILNGIDYAFAKGRFYALAGPNGSGKSTLLKCMCGIESQHSGEVHLMGKPLSAYPHKQRALLQTYVPQQGHAGFDFTTREFVMMGRYPHQGAFTVHTPDDQQMAHRTMTLTDTLQLSSQSVQTLSGGEYQRVVIARALMQNTPIIYLDEPFSQLDLYHQTVMLGLFKDLCIREGKTVICVLHDFNQILAYADEVLIMHNGTIVAHGIPYQTLTPSIIEQVYRVETTWASTSAHTLPGLLPPMPAAEPLKPFNKAVAEISHIIH